MAWEEKKEKTGEGEDKIYLGEGWARPLLQIHGVGVS